MISVLVQLNSDFFFIYVMIVTLITYFHLPEFNSKAGIIVQRARSSQPAAEEVVFMYREREYRPTEVPCWYLRLVPEESK